MIHGEFVDEIQVELDSITMDEVVLATVADMQLKRDIHELIIGHFKQRAEAGETFKVTKRELGLMIVLEGLIVMASGRHQAEKVARSN